MREATLSIIIPVLNEADGLAAFLDHVRSHVPDAELILIDGGSQDGTWELAHALADRHGALVLRSPRGRARQMNLGAAHATGEVLWFLHADSRLPSGCAAAIRTAVTGGLAGGCFRLRMQGTRWVFRVSDALGNVAVDLFRIALGDHGIFCRREVFARLGGYPEVRLMEDALFYEAMVRVSPVRQLRPAIITSTRRYEQLGPWRTTLHFLAILVLYFLRAPASWQEHLYRRLVAPRAPAVLARPSPAWSDGRR